MSGCKSAQSVRTQHSARFGALKGFTLIELLVVIAIIAILASILFPVFARARENARRSSCQSNLKQMALGIKQYTQDYDEKFPSVTTGLGAPGPYGWVDGIQPYLKSTQIFQCPSDSTAPGTSLGSSGYTDYYINAGLGDTSTTTTPDYGAGGINEAAVENPTLTIMNGDIDGNSSTTTARCRSNGVSFQGVSTTNTPAYGTSSRVSHSNFTEKHLGGTNLSFVDGHVKWTKINESASIKGNIYNHAVPFSSSGNAPTFHIKD